MSRRPLLPDRRHALWGGVAFSVLGAVLLWDAYEGRGRERPFWSKLLPGP